MISKKTIFLLLALLFTAASAWAIPIYLDDGDMMQQFGVEWINGPGAFQIEEGGALPFVVKDSQTLANKLGIKGLKNGEHLLLQHINGDRFELLHEATGQKSSLRLPVRK